MQPYFLPYIGYWQLISFVDEFILYDNIKYTKKGWINRNRLLRNGEPAYFTLPLKADSDFSDIGERFLAADYSPESLLRTFDGAYKKAPHYDEVRPMLQNILHFNDRNLFRFLHNSILRISEYLSIDTPIVVSSTLDLPASLRSQERVIATCCARHATQYVNPIGGTELYSRDQFQECGLQLSFLESSVSSYRQFANDFVSHLSIIDVIAFLPRADVITTIQKAYRLT